MAIGYQCENMCLKDRIRIKVVCAVVTNHYVELFTHWLFKCEEPPVKQSITAIGCSMCEDPPTLSSIHNGEKDTNFQK